MALPNNLIHSKDLFSRDSFQNQMDEHGFKNISKLELFLWDLELFLQIQNILKDRVVLKGGAAAQFYLPINLQRSSVDIDMLCDSNYEELTETLETIINEMNSGEDILSYTYHDPEDPKTDLPLYTYYVTVPSDLREDELMTSEEKVTNRTQDVKLDFMISDDEIHINKIDKPSIFALKTDKTYQVLPLEVLIADKLSTLGPTTVGISDDRSDEQIKQIYDIFFLINQNLSKINFKNIMGYYKSRVNIELKVREKNIDLIDVFNDTLNQLEELSHFDINNYGKDIEQQINNFRSLYLRTNIPFKVVHIPVIGLQLKLICKLFQMEDPDINEKIQGLLKIEQQLLFDKIIGPERGEIIRQFKKEYINEFSSQFIVSTTDIENKGQKRIFWEAVTPDSIEHIIEWTTSFIKNNNISEG